MSSTYRIRNLLRKGDNLLSMREGTFQDETNPALTLINMAKESAKYKIRLEEINEFNEVTFFEGILILLFKT